MAIIGDLRSFLEVIIGLSLPIGKLVTKCKTGQRDNGAARPCSQRKTIYSLEIAGNKQVLSSGLLFCPDSPTVNVHHAEIFRAANSKRDN